MGTEKTVKEFTCMYIADTHFYGIHNWNEKRRFQEITCTSRATYT